MSSMLRMSFWSPKGGVGSTTVAANLAACFAYRGSRVVLTDATLQNILQYHFTYLTQPEQSQGQIHISEGTKSAGHIIRTSIGIDIRTAWHKRLFSNERDTINNRSDHFGDGVSKGDGLPDSYDIAITDYMSGSRSGFVHAFRNSDVLIVCVNPEPCSFSTLPLMMDMLSRFEDKETHKKVRILLNKTDAAKTLFSDTRRVIKNVFSDRLIVNELPDDLSVPEAFAKGRTVNSHMPNSKASAVFHEICEELLVQYSHRAGSAEKSRV